MVGCGGGKAPRDRLIIAIESSPSTFDPRMAVDSNSQRIKSLIFNGLMKSGSDLGLEPDLAERYEQMGETLFRFYLRRGVTFHNGRELTAEDVVYTYQSIIDGVLPSPHNSIFQKVKRVEAESPYVVVLELKESFAPFLVMMKMGIVPKDLAEELGDQFGLHPVGTGPYQFIEFKSDAHVLLQTNEKYFGEKAKLPYLEFKVLRDDNVRVLQLMKGSVDLVQNAVPPVLLGMLGKRSDLSVMSDASIVFDYMGMNLTDPLLSKLPIRRALAHAINREEIIKYKWEGYASLSNSLLSPIHWAYNDKVTVYNFDPEKAKQILDAAGYPDPDGDGPEVRFYLSYKTSTQKHRIDIANLIAEQLRQIGIGVNVTPYEWGTFFRDVKTGNFQLYSLSWVGVTEPDLYYNIYHSSQVPPVGANRNRYISEEIDRLTVTGRSTLDLEKRRSIYAEIQRIVSRDLPYIPLWYEDNIVVRRSDVVGYQMRPDAGFQNVVNVTKVLSGKL